MLSAAALWSDELHVEQNRALYAAKFAAAESIFNGRYGFYRPAGGFFLWLDVGDGENATRQLWREAGVRVLPGSYLARPDGAGINPGQPYIRVALVHDLERTTNALSQMKQILDNR